VKIAVTGASGFVGGAVATALADREHDVTGFGRRDDGWVHPLGTYEQWDITRSEHFRAFDAVVHCAALADDWAPRAEAMLVNQVGTRNVVVSFEGARVVHISTSSVYDAFEPSIKVREDAAPVERFLSSYSESKSAAEAELAGLDAVILRPHAVYGPGDTTLLPRIEQGIRGRSLTLPAGARVTHTLTHIDNLIEAVVLSLKGPAGIYNIGDDTDVLLSAVLTEFLARRGRADVSLKSIPYRAAFAAASVGEKLARGRRPRFTRYAVSQLGLERTLDLTSARQQLGYRPQPTSLAGAEDW
jgi:2-alkyl-3-oxoalkanoate reductase